MAEVDTVPGEDSPSGGPKGAPKWDQNRDGIPDVLADEATRLELMRKYGFSEADLRNKAKRELFYEAVRKEYSKKEARKAYDEVYVNDEASIPDIIEKSGFTMELIRAYPELRDVFRKLSDLLARGKITEDQTALYAKFQELIDKTAFGRRTTTEILADLDRYKKGNKQNWDKRVSDMVTRLTEFVTSDSGLTLDLASAQDIALKMIYAGEEASMDALKRRVKAWYDSTGYGANDGTTPGTETDFGGQMGTNQDALTRWFAANGLTVTANEMNNWLSKIRDGGETIDSVKQWYRDNRLALKYAGYADEFAKGFDLTDVAANYQSTMSQLLEKDMNTIGLDDPWLQKALQGTDADGKPKKMTTWEFEKLLRDSPDWQQTNNAMSLYTDIGEGILRTFGFRG